MCQIQPGNEITRRQALRHVSAGALLALGLWPGSVRGGSGGCFKFAVINDTHYMSKECGAWLRGVVRKIKADEPEFCLLAGDLTEQGTEEHLTAVREILKELRVPVYAVIGNHDYATHTDRSPYENIFPGQLNYYFGHKGWQFVGLDTTEGTAYQGTKIDDTTLAWLDRKLRRLDRKAPTVIFTHFPLGAGVQYRPLNADELLERFLEFNLRAVFSGHFHGFTERKTREAVLTTNKCCALKRGNHDKTTEKGYFLCEAAGQTVERRFVQVA